MFFRFCLSSLTFSISVLCAMSYHPFFTRKTAISENNSLITSFFTLFVLSRASDKHYFSKYWGDGCMGRPPSQIFWGAVPKSPLGLRLYVHIDPVVLMLLVKRMFLHLCMVHKQRRQSGLNTMGVVGLGFKTGGAVGLKSSTDGST